MSSTNIRSILGWLDTIEGLFRGFLLFHFVRPSKVKKQLSFNGLKLVRKAFKLNKRLTTTPILNLLEVLKVLWCIVMHLEFFWGVF